MYLLRLPNASQYYDVFVKLSYLFLQLLNVFRSIPKQKRNRITLVVRSVGPIVRLSANYGPFSPEPYLL